MVNTILNVGDKAPEFALEDSHGNMVSTPDLIGVWSVIYFYSKDDTPGCAKEACAFRDGLEKYKKRGVRVYGISADSAESHRKFQDKYHLPFPLLVDQSRQTIEAFGAKKDTGGTKRMTYIIDPLSYIAAIFPNVDPSAHAREILDWFDGRSLS